MFRRIFKQTTHPNNHSSSFKITSLNTLCLGFTFSSLFCYYYKRYYNNNNNYYHFAQAATSVPITNAGENNNHNANSWNNNNTNTKTAAASVVDKNEDGLCSYIFTQNSIPSSTTPATSDDNNNNNINQTGKAGITPLMVAAFTGNTKICKQLLDDFGADPEARSTKPTDEQLARKYFSHRFSLPEGFTALEVAVLGGNEEIIKLVAAAVNSEIPPGNVADRMATIASSKGGMDLSKLQNALSEGRRLRK